MTPPLERTMQALKPPPAWSLIITIYGDAVLPRGGALWLGTLLEIMQAFGIGGGVVRTSMSRLASDGWLERRRVGRNSFYRLTPKGRAPFETATERIYFAPPHAWDGRLRIAFLDEEERAQRRAALETAGFGQLAPGVLLGLDDPGEADGAVILTATDVPEAHGRSLAVAAWPLARMAEGYRRFIRVFGSADLDHGRGLSDLDSLLLRVLLIHEYRRIILHDPLLPRALLPGDWPGHEARALCAKLYRLLIPPSERWLDAHGRTEEGALPPPDARFHTRFRL